MIPDSTLIYLLGDFNKDAEIKVIVVIDGIDK